MSTTAIGQRQSDKGAVSRLKSPEVQFDDQHLTVERLTVTDPTVVDFFRTARPEDRAELARRAFLLGGRALASASGSATMVAISDHLDRIVADAREPIVALPEVIKKQIELVCQTYLGENGTFSGHIDDAVESLGKSFSPQSTEMVKLREAIAADVRKRVVESLKPLADALNINNSDGPLGLLSHNVQQVLTRQTEIKEQVGSALRLQQERALSTKKGFDLEDVVNAVLGDLASTLNDTYEDCSRSSGVVSHSKSGDAVATISEEFAQAADLRIAVEAKNSKSETVAGLVAKLETSVRNRRASVALGILTNPNAQTRPLAIYGRNKIVVHWPRFGLPESDEQHEATLLETAYYMARLLAVALYKDEVTESFDPRVLDGQLEALDKAIDGLRTMAGNLTTIETAVDRARTTFENFRDNIRSICTSIRLTLAEETQRVVSASPRAALK
ncbi:MAG TPA: hypothetical protein VMG98_00650 [Verrucomicrobiae bacterium]|nr:hypothetical protein [Verrucomicrobiae bacterium]